MADLSDIEKCLVSIITQITYPDGTVASSIAGVPCKIHRGWPLPKQLDADLRAGKITVSVYPTATEKRTTRYDREWQVLSSPTPMLGLTATNATITVTGTPASPLNAAVIVNGTAYIYPVQPGDTLNSIATGLAALIAEDTPATSSGAAITIPAAARLEARVGGAGTLIREIRRQKRTFQVTCWCPSPDARDLIAPAIDAAMADIDFLALLDGSAGRLLYERSHVTDGSQVEGLYRRDLFYSVEYATTQVQGATQIVVIPIKPGDFDGNPIPPLPVRPGALLLESGGYLLLETGGRILLESTPFRPPSLLLESGGYLLLESGGRILLDLNTKPASLKMESGAYLLLEGGGRILLAEPESIALEDGTVLTTEDGVQFGLETAAVIDALALEGGDTLITEDGKIITPEG